MGDAFSARSALVLGGVAGPLLFATAVVVSAGLRPEYSHYAQFISELGETGSRSEAVMNFAGFLPAGFLILVSSRALVRRFGGAWAGALGAACVALAGVGMFASGIFSCDLGCTPDAPTLDQRLHDVAGLVTFPAFVAAPLLLGLRFRQLEGWRSLFPYSIATSALALCALVAMVSSVPDRSGTGVFQRLVLGGVFLWLAWVSWRVFASPEHTP